MKKLNALIGFFSILVLIGHFGTMSYSMLTGWYNFSVCKGLAHATAWLVSAHVILVLCIVLFLHDGASMKNAGMNARVIIQRSAGIVMILLLHKHIKDFGFIVTGAVPGGIGKAVLIATELLFFGSVFSHSAVSFSRIFITLGLCSDEKTIKHIDKTAYIICGAAFIIVSTILIRFVISFGG